MNRFKTFQQSYDDAIESIKQYIDPNSENTFKGGYTNNGSEAYKEASTLCKFLFELNDADLYEVIRYYNGDRGNHYANAIEFSALCNTIYHAIIDDGDIAYVQINDKTPFIVFADRHEITWEHPCFKEDRDMIECLNSSFKKCNIAPKKQKLKFYDNAYGFMKGYAKRNPSVEFDPIGEND